MKNILLRLSPLLISLLLVQPSFASKELNSDDSWSKMFTQIKKVFPDQENEAYIRKLVLTSYPKNNGEKEDEIEKVIKLLSIVEDYNYYYHGYGEDSSSLGGMKSALLQKSIFESIFLHHQHLQKDEISKIVEFYDYLDTEDSKASFTDYLKKATEICSLLPFIKTLILNQSLKEQNYCANDSVDEDEDGDEIRQNHPEIIFNALKDYFTGCFLEKTTMPQNSKSVFYFMELITQYLKNNNVSIKYRVWRSMSSEDQETKLKKQKEDLQESLATITHRLDGIKGDEDLSHLIKFLFCKKENSSPKELSLEGIKKLLNDDD